jgi:outer membrane protein assembly factor BamB
LIAQVENDTESYTLGVDVREGTNRWRLDRPKLANWTSPVILSEAGRTLVALQSGKGLAAVEPATGKVVWNYTEGASTIPSGAPAGGVVLVPSSGLTALQPEPGQAAPRQLWRTAQLRPGTSSPAVVNDRVYVLNDAGVLNCGEAATGKRLWQLRLKGPFSASPVVAETHLFALNEKGLLQVVDLTAPEGAVVSERDLGQTVLATPAIAGQALFARSDSTLWKLGRR